MSFQNWLKNRHYGPVYDVREMICGGRQWMERMKAVSRLEGHSGCVNSVLFSFHNLGMYTYTGSDDQMIGIWETDMVCKEGGSYNCREQSDYIKYVSTSHTNNIFYVRDVPFTCGKELVSCAADGKVILHTLPDSGGHFEQVIARHNGRAHRVAMAPDSSKILYTAGEDGVINQVDLRKRTLDEESSEGNHNNNRSGSNLLIVNATEFLPAENSMAEEVPIYSINVDPLDPTKIIAAGASPFVCYYDLRYFSEPVCRFTAFGHSDEVIDIQTSSHITAVKFNHDGTELLASYSGAGIFSFNVIRDKWPEDLFMSTSSCTLSPPRFRQKFEGHCNIQTVKQVSYHGHRSEFVVTGSDTGHVFVYDAATGEKVRVVKADERGAVNCLASHPLDNLLATSGLSHYATFFRPVGDRVSTKSQAERDRIEAITAESQAVEEEEEEMRDRALLVRMMVAAHLRRAETEGNRDDNPDFLRFLLRQVITEGIDQDSHDEDEEDEDDDNDNDDDDDDDDEDEGEDPGPQNTALLSNWLRDRDTSDCAGSSAGRESGDADEGDHHSVSTAEGEGNGEEEGEEEEEEEEEEEQHATKLRRKC